MRRRNNRPSHPFLRQSVTIPHRDGQVLRQVSHPNRHLPFSFFGQRPSGKSLLPLPREFQQLKSVLGTARRHLPHHGAPYLRLVTTPQGAGLFSFDQTGKSSAAPLARIGIVRKGLTILTSQSGTVSPGGLCSFGTTASQALNRTRRREGTKVAQGEPDALIDTDPK